MTKEMDKLRDQIGGPQNWVQIEKFKILTMLELWMIAQDVVRASGNTASPAFKRTLSELRRVVEKLG